MNRRPIVVLSLVLGLLAGTSAAAEGLRVLIFSGQNNHNWRETTPKLKSILETSGRFAVEVTEQPAGCDAATLAGYDVIVSDWNTWGPAAAKDWPDATRQAFLDFVRSGKGFVVVHAGGSSFTDWPEYQQIAGAWWELGQTNHGAPHRFTVQPIADHPITRGLQPFRTTDELWQKPGIHPAATVLATGDDQPLALVTRLGQGRGFALLLGHSAAFMEPAGFQLLLRRGVEWAATGQVSAADLPRALAAYQYGQSRAVLREVAGLAQAAPRALAPQLAALLETEATLEAKQFACEQLGLIGTAAEVPALARQLGQPDLAWAARSALERIAGDESLAALRAALPAATGASRQGLINSLAARRDAHSVPLLAELLPAAADALAAIGTAEALAALQAARPQPTAALLRCALQRGDLAVLEQLSAADQPRAVRTAAFTGRVRALGEQGGAAILAALSGGDPTLQRAALGLVSGSRVVPAAAQLLGEFPAELQLPLLAALADSGETAVLPAVLPLATSPDRAVRSAALAAIGKLGDASTVPLLLERLAAAERDERQAIVDAFTRLRGPGVDEALVQSPQAETLRALVARGATSAVPALLELAASGNTEAIGALGKLAGAADGPPLMALLDQAEERQPLEAALAALYRRVGDVQTVADAAAQARGPRQASLLAVLGVLGGEQALPTLRAALHSENAEARLAAARALGDWPNGAPLADLQAVAETATDAKLKALAARGAARLEALEFDVTGMPNLAAGGQATSSDGLPSDGQGGPPAAAIDGDANTYWDEVDNEPRYQIQVQMKQPATVRALRIIGFRHQQYAPKDFEILGDGQRIKTVTDAPYRDNVLTVVLPPTRCTTIELNITGAYGPSPAIRELEIYGTVP